MNAQKLIDTAEALVADDKGLLATNESNPTRDKRFARLGIPQTEETRRAYREMIITTPGLSECISGAILYDETIRQEKMDGTPFAQAIQQPALEIWRGKQVNILAAQEALYHRAWCNRAARRGEYEAAMEKSCA